MSENKSESHWWLVLDTKLYIAGPFSTSTEAEDYLLQQIDDQGYITLYSGLEKALIPPEDIHVHFDPLFEPEVEELEEEEE
tara:strand:- start:319 stop:561 length:243 start_codon:yes stop_codon:yes gene_type:complete